MRSNSEIKPEISRQDIQLNYTRHVWWVVWQKSYSTIRQPILLLFSRFFLHHTHAVCRKGPNIYISLISGLPSFSHTKTTGEEVDNSSRRSSRDQIYNTRQNSSFQTSNTLFPIRIHFNNFWEKNFIKKWTTADDHLLAPTQRIFQPPPLNENSLWLDRIENVGKQKLYNTLFFFPIFLDAKRRFSSSL